MDGFSEDSFVVVYRGTDTLEAQMLEELLGQQGIPARLLGTRCGTLIGAPQYIFEQRIEVPAEHEGQALALIQAFRSSQPEANSESEDADVEP